MLVYETDAQWSHWAMQTWWRGTTRGNGIPGDQRSRQIIDMTSSCQVMSSCKSHENVVQGHLVTLGPGAKNKMEQQDCMPLDLTIMYGQCCYGNTTNTGMMEGFAVLTHQCESCIEGNKAKT